MTCPSCKRPLHADANGVMTCVNSRCAYYSPGVRKLVACVVAVLALVIVPSASARTFPLWGNDRIADCTFAAAADWEVAALGHLPPEAEVINEFHEAEGSDENGIPPADFRRYWREHGIGGVKAIVKEVPGIDLWDWNKWTAKKLRAVVRREHYLLVGLTWGLGHEALILSAGHAGITIATWGEERFIPWREAREQITSVSTVRLKT